MSIPLFVVTRSQPAQKIIKPQNGLRAFITATAFISMHCTWMDWRYSAGIFK
jgi:hypothetical protein